MAVTWVGFLSSLASFGRALACVACKCAYNCALGHFHLML